MHSQMLTQSTVALLDRGSLLSRIPAYHSSPVYFLNTGRELSSVHSSKYTTILVLYTTGYQNHPLRLVVLSSFITVFLTDQFAKFNLEFVFESAVPALARLLPVAAMKISSFHT